MGCSLSDRFVWTCGINVHFVYSQLIRHDRKAQIIHVFICSHSAMWCTGIQEKPLGLLMWWKFIIIYHLDYCKKCTCKQVIKIWIFPSPWSLTLKTKKKSLSFSSFWSSKLLWLLCKCFTSTYLWTQNNSLPSGFVFSAGFLIVIFSPVFYNPVMILKWTIFFFYQCPN